MLKSQEQQRKQHDPSGETAAFDNGNPNTRPRRCAYIVRFWMSVVGYGRQEREAENAIEAATEVRDILKRKYPDADVVIVASVRK